VIASLSSFFGGRARVPLSLSCLCAAEPSIGFSGIIVVNLPPSFLYCLRRGIDRISFII